MPKRLLDGCYLAYCLCWCWVIKHSDKLVLFSFLFLCCPLHFPYQPHDALLRTCHGGNAATVRKTRKSREKQWGHYWMESKDRFFNMSLTVQSDLPPSTLQPHILMTYHATYPNSPKGVKATCPSDLMGQKNVLKTYVYTYIYFPFPQHVWDLPMFWCRTCGSMVKPRGSGVWFHLNQWPCYNSSQISLQVHICEISIC